MLGTAPAVLGLGDGAANYKIGVPPPRGGGETLQQRPLDVIVGVEKDDEGGRGHFQSTVPRRARTAIGAARPADSAAEGFDNLETAIGRTVVDDDEFLTGIALVENALDRTDDPFFTVVTRDNNGKRE